MHRLYEFKIVPAKVEETIQVHYVTESSRMSKVAKKILVDVNKLRVKEGLEPWKHEDLQSFQIRELKRH